MGKVEEYRSLLKRGVVEIIVEEELVTLLESGRKLRLKQGFDPSRPDIHLGHVVGLRKLRQFQELGHQLILIVGDWTAQIGDPSGESQTRPMLSAEEVRANAETYMKQFFKVVDRDKTQVVWQSEWFGNFTLADVIALTSKFTVAQMLQRDDFATRYSSGRPIAVTEFLYPLLQAYDSVMIEADVEFGGTDQKFNCLVGRELQQMMGQPPQQVFLMPLLVGTDGRQKMSKSLGNYIGVDEPPNDMYGKVMSVPDELIMDYFELLTDVAHDELAQFKAEMESQSTNPMILKKRLAREIVTQFHDEKAADGAQARFEREVQKGEVPEQVIELSVRRLIEMHREKQRALVTLSREGEQVSAEELRESVLTETWWEGGPHAFRPSIALILDELQLVRSRSEAKRLVQQGAVEIIAEGGDTRTVHDDAPSVKVGDVIRVGKRRFVKIVDTD